ncbi:MAG TPA: hypothetical protein VED19_00775 [Candidatus Nitrosopolaris sp.]|nr:hypothetical protein [Candidatus Nitrosopolaris sp.]
MKNILMIGCLGALAIESSHAGLTNEPPAALPTKLPADARYGLFNWLDSRSIYGQDVFPEPFLVDDSDLETGEARLDWLHTASGGDHTDIVHPELEWGFGNLTLELEVPYERDVEDGSVTKGFDNVDIGARYPFYQFVSQNGSFDTTFGAGIELGIPTTSDVSHNTELVPKIFNDTKIGNFTMQSIFGYSMLYGPGDDGGVNTFEYGFVFGYNIPHQVLPVPGVDKIIPVAELSGETQLNKDDSGQTSLTADGGLRVNLKSIGGIQPRPGVVFVFPLNSNTRQETHWGIMTSLVFKF